jgi:hypothetical protein
MEILVAPSSSKSQVLELAKALRKKYAINDRFVNIHIFDNETAYRNRENESYPEAEYFRHFLVTINVNPNTGYDEIEWQARGRDH